jgi:hypothetical protein
MVSLNPKQLFQANSQQREEWSQIVANPLTHRAIAMTYAVLVASGLSPDGLAGVNSAFHVFLNLSEDVIAQKPLPGKHLRSYDAPTKTLTEPLK